MFYKITRKILDEVGDVLAIILFGSYARFGKGQDIDLIVIIRDKLNLKKKEELERNLASKLNKEFNYKYLFDIHIFDLETFKKNLRPPNFLSGLFLGYEILYDKIGIKTIIEEKRKDAKGYTLVDKYGIWRL